MRGSYAQVHQATCKTTSEGNWRIATAAADAIWDAGGAKSLQQSRSFTAKPASALTEEAIAEAIFRTLIDAPRERLLRLIWARSVPHVAGRLSPHVDTSDLIDCSLLLRTSGTFGAYQTHGCGAGMVGRGDDLSHFGLGFTPSSRWTWGSYFKGIANSLIEPVNLAMSTLTPGRPGLPTFDCDPRDLGCSSGAGTVLALSILAGPLLEGIQGSRLLTTPADDAWRASAATAPRPAGALPQALTAGRNAETGVHVYHGVEGGKRVYVGITSSIERRQAQHGSRFLLDPLTSSPVTRGQARAIEEALIVRAGGVVREGGIFQNIRHSISPQHYWYQDALDWGNTWLRGNGL